MKLVDILAEAPIESCLHDALERAWQKRDSWYEIGQTAAIKITNLYQHSIEVIVVNDGFTEITNILHINQSDIAGGAAIPGYRLHQGLLAQGLDSRLLVGGVKTSSDRVATVPISKRRLENQLYRFTWRFGLNYLHLLGSFDIPKHSFYQEADILNFHNLHTGYFNYLAIPSLTENKPAVFTLHDMWSFTGHCAYSYDCDRWKSGCGKCPYPDTYPAVAEIVPTWSGN